MNKYKISIISLAAVLAASSASFVATISASAERQVAVNGSNVFQALRDATVTAYKTTEEGEDAYYPAFNLGEGDSVAYRKDLAYTWYENDGNDNGVKTNFSMEMGFTELNFQSYTVKFQSQQYNKTKAGVSDNYVVFVPDEGKTGVYAYVTSDEEELDKTAADLAAENANLIADYEKFSIEFGDRTGADYQVTVAGVEYVFENIGGTYAQYVSASRTNPATPITFSATLPENASKDVQSVIYSLNGQSFKLISSTVKETETGLSSGSLNDDTAPVLCLKEDVPYLEAGKELSVETVAIDVVASSPSVTTHFYILTQEQQKNAGYAYNDAENFTEIREDDEYYMMETKDSYYPETLPEAFGTEFTPSCLAKVYYNLTDVSSNGVSQKVFLDWYLKDEYAVDINGSKFIAVGDSEEGLRYTADKSVFDDYQAKLDELTKDENGLPKINAGSSNHLYLPSVEELFKGSLSSYTDLTFSIYYNCTSKKSRTSLSSSDLSINVDTDGIYVFTVYATDAAGNTMYYLDGEGEVVKIAASEIWDYFDDDDKRNLDIVPWFTFKVGYEAASAEAPGAQDVGYVGTAYTGASFDINGVSGKYTAEYSLALFDRAAYTSDHGSISYSEFIDKVQELYESVEGRKYFTLIPASADLSSTDEEYERFNDYAWNKTSLSFVPQEKGTNSFYVIRLQLTDKVADGATSNYYMAISVSAKATALKGESEWLKNNIASIILLSIAALSLIGIVVLIIVKPKQTGDIDVIEAEEEKESKKSKKN